MLCLFAALAAFVAAAPPASAEPALEVQAGFGGLHEFGADLVVRVLVETDRLVDGTLQALPNAQFGSVPVVEIQIEAAGGSTKEFLLVIPSFEQWGGAVQVNLIESGVTTASTNAAVNGLREGELVGVLPGLADELSGRTSFSVPIGTARTFPIDERWLDAGVGAIDALSSIVVTATDLQALSPANADVLDQWIFQGGTLIADEPAGLLPGVNITAEESPVAHGHGRVVITAWSRSQGDGSSIIAPAERRMTMDNPFPEMTGDMPWFGGQLATELANDAGFGLPPVPWVLGLLALYIVLAGPIAWFVLRRLGKARLLWSLLPAIALVFTAGIWLAGTAIRSNTTNAHGTIIEVADGRAHVSSTILALSRGGGRVTTNLPDSWRAAQSQTEPFGPGIAEGPTRLFRTGPGADRIDVDLAAGQFATITGRGTDPSFVGAVTAVANAPKNGTINGSVTNNLDIELHEVAVFTGGAGVNIGSIGPNATVPFTFNARGQDRFGEPIEAQLWRDSLDGRFGRFNGQQLADPDPKVNISLWSNYITENLGRSRPLGEITIAGWTNELASPLDSDVESGRTLLVASAPISIANDVLTDVANQRVILRSPTQLDGGEPNFGAGFVLGTAWRFDIPAGVDLSTIGLQLPGQISSIELWDGAAWRVTESTREGLYRLPEQVIHQGSVTAKIFIDFDRGPTTLGSGLALRTILPDETALDDLVAGATS